MTLEIIIVFLILLGTIVLFSLEKMPVDLAAIIVMVALLATGIITPGEAVSGFSNPATITVGAMFIISAALNKTGALLFLGNISTRMFKYGFWFALFVTMCVVAMISAFMNNTPVVAVFIPILLSVARNNSISPSKLLMPLSFASIFGGVCTLIGTSTNILVSSIVEQHGQPALGMFEFTTMGIIFFAIGTLYMVFIGVRLIPNRQDDNDLTQSFRMNDYLTDIVILPEAKSIGKRLIDSPLVKELDLDILYVVRNSQRLLRPTSTIFLEPYDVLRVRCDIEKIRTIQERVGVELKSDLKIKQQDIEAADILLVEAIVAPNSELEGQTLKSIDFRNKFRATTLALRHRGQLLHEGIGRTRLNAGDALLIDVRKENYDYLKNNPNFVLVSDVKVQKYRKRKIIPAVAIVGGVVVVASSGTLPIMASALIGSILLVLVGCLKLEEAYQAIEWKIIFLLGGILSLGLALEKTGAAVLISNLLISWLGSLGPVAIVAALYLLTSLLTETMSNNATAVLLTPIAISAAVSMNVDPRPLIMAVMFGSSASFMTPVGYQTNTMIYSVGRYKFSDFLKVGAPLNIIFWLAASLLIPYFFPF
ncbi:MAG: potassium transporter TrkA [Ignavibacteria bacterium GWB2_36_8]|nr:MAG: potassium transporter TrkA [Ignavibacteria bacterium GWB2_36_8]OGU50151.1 MAG: potassium transporter TrkA [Ignavibacteria bacterium GWC2_36_12]OGU95601.1 MAG: potassium transporter TrkA [Ignavibacteria bacterium RIFOXYB2_FULL_36_7]